MTGLALGGLLSTAGVGYAGLFVLVFAESAGFPVPGETALIAASILTTTGRLSLAPVLGIAAAAAIAGDNVGYFVGRRGGRWLLLRDGVLSARRRTLVARGDAFFARHGAKAVFLGRFVPWLRISAAWLAGASRMRWRTFLLWNALGGVSWAILIGLAAHLLGTAAGAVLGATGVVLLTIAVLGVLAVVASRRRRRSPASDGTISGSGTEEE